MNPIDRDRLIPLGGSPQAAAAEPLPRPVAVPAAPDAPVLADAGGSVATPADAVQWPAEDNGTVDASADVAEVQEPGPAAGGTEPAAPAPVSAVDAAMAGIDMTAPRVSAAQQAAEFVARIFADVQPESEQAPAAADRDPPAAERADAEAGAASADGDAPATPEQGDAAVPQGRPADTLRPLAGRRILILGLGASGLAMGRWGVRCGADAVSMVHTPPAPLQVATLQADGRHV